jgi:plastocyanin
MPRRFVAVSSAFLVAVVACSSSTDYGSGGSNPPPSADVLILSGASTKGASAFDPNPFTVSLGGAATVDVKWGNADGITHTVTADGASPLFSSGNVGPGMTFTFSFTAAGSYSYHCSIHPTMVGTVQVTQ